MKSIINDNNKYGWYFFIDIDVFNFHVLLFVSTSLNFNSFGFFWWHVAIWRYENCIFGWFIFFYYLIGLFGEVRSMSELGEDDSWSLSEYSLIFLIMRRRICWSLVLFSLFVLFKVDVIFIAFILVICCILVPSKLTTNLMGLSLVNGGFYRRVVFWVCALWIT